MASDTANRATWAAWLRHQLHLKGWSQKGLCDASHGELNLKTVGKWFHGQADASVEKVVTTARVLNAPLPTALRAAGYPLIAAALDAAAASTDTQPPHVQQSMNSAVDDILAADLLTEAEKADYIDLYRQDIELIDRRMRRMVRDVTGTRTPPGGNSHVS